MNKSVSVAVAAALLLAAGGPFAQDAKAPTPDSAAATQPPSSTNAVSQMGQMDEHMKDMQALHNRMMSATTPEDRQRVMDEQRKKMQASMEMMNQTTQGAMMGGMGPGTMNQNGKPADAGAQMQMMQKRMDMMQMMMQTMMDQQGMMSGMRGMDASPRK